MSEQQSQDRNTVSFRRHGAIPLSPLGDSPLAHFLWRVCAAISERGRFAAIAKHWKAIIGVCVAVALMLIVPHLQTKRFAARHGEVWVNTRTGIYHGSSDKWYGDTQFGVFLPRWLASHIGFRASREASPFGSLR